MNQTQKDTLDSAIMGAFGPFEQKWTLVN